MLFLERLGLRGIDSPVLPERGDGRLDYRADDFVFPHLLEERADDLLHGCGKIVEDLDGGLISDLVDRPEENLDELLSLIIRKAFDQVEQRSIEIVGNRGTRLFTKCDPSTSQV